MEIGKHAQEEAKKQSELNNQHEEEDEGIEDIFIVDPLQFAVFFHDL